MFESYLTYKYLHCYIHPILDRYSKQLCTDKYIKVQYSLWKLFILDFLHHLLLEVEDENPLGKEDKELEQIQEVEDLHMVLLLVEDIHRRQDDRVVLLADLQSYCHRNLPGVHLELGAEVDRCEVPDLDLLDLDTDQTDLQEVEVQPPVDTDQEEPGTVEAAVLDTVPLVEEWRSLVEMVTRLRETELGCCWWLEQDLEQSQRPQWTLLVRWELSRPTWTGTRACHPCPCHPRPSCRQTEPEWDWDHQDRHPSSPRAGELSCRPRDLSDPRETEESRLRLWLAPPAPSSTSQSVPEPSGRTSPEEQDSRNAS